MAKPFVTGLSPRVDAAFQTTEALYRAVGHDCGNLAFTHAIHAHLSGELPATGWHGPCDRGDIAVFPASNQLGAYWAATPRLAKRFHDAGVPSALIGLGIAVGIGHPGWEYPHRIKASLGRLVRRVVRL